MTIEQQRIMPWIRAISAPLSTLPTSGVSHGTVDLAELTIETREDTVSTVATLDFIRAEDAAACPEEGQWDLSWHGVTLRARLSTCPGQIATLSWFHSF